MEKDLKIIHSTQLMTVLYNLCCILMNWRSAIQLDQIGRSTNLVTQNLLVYYECSISDNTMIIGCFYCLLPSSVSFKVEFDSVDCID